MALTRLKNIITSRTGRIIYVNPDDFEYEEDVEVEPARVEAAAAVYTLR